MITEHVYIHRYGYYPEIKQLPIKAIARIHHVHTEHKYNQRPLVYNANGQVIRINSNLIDTLA